jgi:hypothetical protein
MKIVDSYFDAFSFTWELSKRIVKEEGKGSLPIVIFGFPMFFLLMWFIFFLSKK